MQKLGYLTSDIFGLGNPRRLGLGIKNIKTSKPRTPMMIPGTMKESDQAVETNAAAIREPRILPKDVCEFQMPNIKPVKNPDFRR